MEWIKTSDRLPELYDRVLIMHMYKVIGLRMGIGFTGEYKNQKGWFIEGKEFTVDLSVVTRWMPLPSPPKE